MLKKFEIPIFKREFSRLSLDYKRCPDEGIKSYIKEDILLITEVLTKKFI